MFRPDPKDNYPAICNLVPGYGYYRDMGYGLAESFVNLIEWLFNFRR